MKNAYLLWHTREDDKYMEDSKLLGVYSSEELAQEKIDTYYKFQDGFKDYYEGFLISKYTVDKMEWTEGFVRD